VSLADTAKAADWPPCFVLLLSWKSDITYITNQPLGTPEINILFSVFTTNEKNLPGTALMRLSMSGVN
jgi:hypothetical protein